MGRPKALLEAAGATLLERTVALVSTWRPALIGAPPFGLPGLGDLELLADRRGVDGPLAAILSAFDHDPRAAWIVIACDLPLLSSAALEWLIGERRAERVAVLPALGAQRVEPLLALYEPLARPLLETLATEPDRSLQRLRDLPGVATPCPPRALQPAWTNVNTPEEWAAARRVSRRPRSSSPTSRGPRGRGPRRR
jgi:molybdopterin-guanine dinucleotide biosynthesis protein A